MTDKPVPISLQGEKAQRYKRNFIEIRELSNDGKTSVRLVRSRLDGNAYMIKRVSIGKRRRFGGKTQELLANVQNEVSQLSKISHPNIVRYYDAWVEEDESVTLSSQPKKPRVIRRRPFELEHEFDETSLQNFEFASTDDDKKEVKMPRVMKKSILESLRECKLKKTQLKTSSPSYVFVQTEVTEQTLERYLARRNENLASLKRHSLSQFEVAKVRYEVEARHILKQILTAVEYLHQELQLAHLDLSPDSIFVDRELNVKVGTFAAIKSLCPEEIQLLARTVSDFSLLEPLSLLPRPAVKSMVDIDAKPTLRSTLTTCSSLFASPEARLGEEKVLSDKSDVWSVAMITIVLLYPTFTLMERDEVLKLARDRYFPEVFEQKWPRLTSLINEMLSYRPFERPSISMVQSELLHSLNQLIPVQVRKECGSVWKERFLYVDGNTILIFSSRDDMKARLAIDIGSRTHIFENIEGQTLVIGCELQKQIEVKTKSQLDMHYIHWTLRLSQVDFVPELK
eukprot:TRINITY_DN8520_c0_g1_i1.p1 TRINITY_DN8520_c0_g1~~TRINITY_DN8520_c0_g1_i1.p1  ORF type:complete len:512 (+),score=111.37 TRINITY_DN8520_c0_g1_i1:44-1579(+)